MKYVLLTQRKSEKATKKNWEWGNEDSVHGYLCVQDADKLKCGRTFSLNTVVKMDGRFRHESELALPFGKDWRPASKGIARSYRPWRALLATGEATLAMSTESRT